MAYFAELDGNNIVIRVVAIGDAEEADGENFCINLFGTLPPNSWKQTSINTRDGVHYDADSWTPDGGVALRKEYASIGMTYDPIRDEFVFRQPHNSWTLDSSNNWNPPTPYPDANPWEDGYDWNEDTLSWEERGEPE